VARRETGAGPEEAEEVVETEEAEETADRGQDLAADLAITEGAGAPRTGPCPGRGRTPHPRETRGTRKK